MTAYEYILMIKLIKINSKAISITLMRFLQVCKKLLKNLTLF